MIILVNLTQMGKHDPDSVFYYQQQFINKLKIDLKYDVDDYTWYAVDSYQYIVVNTNMHTVSAKDEIVQPVLKDITNDYSIFVTSNFSYALWLAATETTYPIHNVYISDDNIIVWEEKYEPKYHRYRKATVDEVMDFIKDEMVSCQHCRKYNPIPITSNYCNMNINRYKKTLTIGYSAYSCDSSFNESIPIKFCPICGREL